MKASIFFCGIKKWRKRDIMFFINRGSVCPQSGYLISETEKNIIRLLVNEAKSNLDARSLIEKESVLNELI